MLPAIVMEKLLKESTTLRVSEKAKLQLNETLKRRLDSVTRKSIELAMHAGRITVKGEDVVLALEQS